MRNKGANKIYKILAVIITVIVFISSVCYYGSKTESSSETYEDCYERCERNGDEYAKYLDEKMEQRDYISIYTYYRTKNIYFNYDSQYYYYNDVCRAADNFEIVYESLLSIYCHDISLEDAIKYQSGTLASYVKYIEELTRPENVAEKSYPDNVNKYMENIRKDTGGFLKFYLGLTDEQIESIGTLSENQVGVMMEEAITNEW